jgi:hypothetical protein
MQRESRRRGAPEGVRGILGAERFPPPLQRMRDQFFQPPEHRLGVGGEITAVHAVVGRILGRVDAHARMRGCIGREARVQRLKLFAGTAELGEVHGLHEAVRVREPALLFAAPCAGEGHRLQRQCAHVPGAQAQRSVERRQRFLRFG